MLESWPRPRLCPLFVVSALASQGLPLCECLHRCLQGKKSSRLFEALVYLTSQKHVTRGQ